MRTIANAHVTFASPDEVSGDKQATVVVQGSTASALLQSYRSAITPFVKANQGAAQWVVVFVDLAGGGDGLPFVLALRLADESDIISSGVSVERDFDPGEVEEQPFPYNIRGSQSESLEASSKAGLQQLRALGFAPDSPLAPNAEANFVQSLLGGASSGGAFMSTLFGERAASTNNG